MDLSWNKKVWMRKYNLDAKLITTFAVDKKIEFFRSIDASYFNFNLIYLNRIKTLI